MRGHSFGFYLSFALLATAAYGWENYCKERGIFPHPDDCTSFLTCHGPDNNEYKMISHQCPIGQAFDTFERSCVSLEDLPECKQQMYGMSDPYASNPACANQAVHCANCTHLVFCQIVGIEYQNPIYENCAYSESTKPFCDNNIKACSANLPAGCDKPGFVCTSAGVFPDPKQCDMYHVCYNTTSYDSFRCGEPEKTEYHSQEFRCGANNGTECEAVSCEGILGVTAFPRDPRYYVLCISGSKDEVYSCPGNTEFINPTEGCAFQCHSAGLFPNHENCTKFHRCDVTEVEGEFEHVIDDCPTGLAFNPISLSCDAKSNVKC